MTDVPRGFHSTLVMEEVSFCTWL